MFALERRQFIVREAQKRGSVDVADLAATIGVTTETVRRDLTLLEQQNILRRVHGGAVPVESVNPVPGLAEGPDLMASAKRAIGKRAAALLPRTGTILIDSGTTTAQLAAAIPEDRELTVITNAPPIGESLVRLPLLTVHLLGGRLRPSPLATVDHWALEQLGSLDVDVAFIGTYGISSARGFSTPDSFESAVKRAMVKSAKKVVVLADNTKMENSFMSVFAPLDSVDVLVTDSGAPREKVAALRESGLPVELSRRLGRGEAGERENRAPGRSLTGWPTSPRFPKPSEHRSGSAPRS
ncbi:DeoR/GlpR family DNA-binding transcription regulator [Sciscionella sediminilitoris]|uniref:DeoR/GlpR family DNA-binding transcription regulator n=1 Tax=Sciscionella sediminilitoris TaxID=1445613 RepID=UPI0009EA7A41|nr:DeoR/GlpR family DNA-binding transcription regulator [Sciscionella sp. SE31]